jgi:hypothetical protein
MTYVKITKNLGVMLVWVAQANTLTKRRIITMEKKQNTMTKVKTELLNIIDPFGECDHGMMRCTCGVCTKHPMSVSIKGGHVKGTSSGGYIHSIGFCGK